MEWTGLPHIYPKPALFIVIIAMGVRVGAGNLRGSCVGYEQSRRKCVSEKKRFQQAVICPPWEH